MEIISRAEAKAQGLTQYYTGEPCKAGHLAGRWVANRRCAQCARERNTVHHRVWKRANLERVRAWDRAWQRANPACRAAGKAKRRANKLRATPPWLTQEQIRRMAGTYVAAKKYEALSGIDWHVDHVIPLRGENVCGLHVPWNLQVLPAAENLSKGNKLLGAAE